MLALSVSISTSSSPRLTSSPSDFSHLRIVPSSMESDRRGIATSAMRRKIPGDRRATSCHGGGGHALLLGDRRRSRHGGKREAEHRAAALAFLDPDPAALALDDLAADRQADPGALERLAVVQALEHLEHALPVAGVDADPVVGD